MLKTFNITGRCFPAQHYMADVSGKIAKIIEMVEKGNYFTINRPRQYGKTTYLYLLASTLRFKDNIVFNMSFEGIGDSFFVDEKAFSQGFVDQLHKYATIAAPELQDWLTEEVENCTSLSKLSKLISKMVAKLDKRVILLIDEVDKSSNNQLFVSFLAMLRNKYLERDEFKTFHSIVLAGVHDVKTLKLKIRPGEEQKFNSPWNIAIDFLVDMNLQKQEILPMLAEYQTDKGVQMDQEAIADGLLYYTSGYPFLVSKLCKTIDELILPEKQEKTWTIADLENAVQRLIKEQNTNFDSLIKNLNDYEELYQLVKSLVIDAENIPFSIYDNTISLGVLHGIFVNQGHLAIHNRIYREVLANYMSSMTLTSYLAHGVGPGGLDAIQNNQLDLEKILLKFQAFLREHSSQKDRNFLEREGRLLFLAFLKPVLNGHGYDFKEPQVSDEKRLDVVITFHQHRYLLELKIWRGEAQHQHGLQQLSNYLDKLNLKEGYLLIFDHRQVGAKQGEWIDFEGKRIFVVGV